MKELFKSIMNLLDRIASVKPEIILIVIFAAILAAFAVFALCKFGSRFRKETKLLTALNKQIGEKGISDAEDAEGVRRALAGSESLSFGWKRYTASDTLTPFDVFKGKQKRAGSSALGVCEALIVLAAIGFSMLFRSSSVLEAEYGAGFGQQLLGLCAMFAIVAAACVWIDSGICRCQAKHRRAAERAFAETLETAFPLAKKNRIKNNRPETAVHSFRVEEVKAEHVEEPQVVAEPEADSLPESETQPEAVRAQAGEPSPESGAVAIKSESRIDEIIRKINEVKENGASIQTMQQIASLLQKEREKKENKTVAQQRRLNEALAELLRAMSRYK